MAYGIGDLVWRDIVSAASVCCVSPLNTEVREVGSRYILRPEYRDALGLTGEYTRLRKLLVELPRISFHS